jgi:hypothetical protein
MKVAHDPPISLLAFAVNVLFFIIFVFINNNNNYKISHIGHCTHTTKSANLEAQNILHGQNDITCSTNCKYRTAAATIYPTNMACSGI